MLAAANPLNAQRDSFRWMDFHSPKDQDIIAWVSRTLAGENWTAVREVGVQYDAALVVTTLRPSPEAAANGDTFTVWSVSLTQHTLAPLITGVNLRWLNFMKFSDGGSPEPAILYDGCRECAAETYFTAFHYDFRDHGWSARWLRGGKGAPVWSTNMPAAVVWTQVYGGLAEPNGSELLGTWNHFDYGAQKQPDDFVFRYDLDPVSGLERTQILSGKDAEAMKQRLCRAQDVLPGMGRGQDGPLCQSINPRPERKPVTTPPANNRGKSTPPGSKH